MLLGAAGAAFAFFSFPFWPAVPAAGVTSATLCSAHGKPEDKLSIKKKGGGGESLLGNLKALPQSSVEVQGFPFSLEHEEITKGGEKCFCEHELL